MKHHGQNLNVSLTNRLYQKNGKLQYLSFIHSRRVVIYRVIENLEVTLLKQTILIHWNDTSKVNVCI